MVHDSLRFGQLGLRETLHYVSPDDSPNLCGLDLPFFLGLLFTRMGVQHLLSQNEG